jgi:hypothetical protein
MARDLEAIRGSSYFGLINWRCEKVHRNGSNLLCAGSGGGGLIDLRESEEVGDILEIGTRANKSPNQKYWNHFHLIFY